MSELTHFNAAGDAHMVDISAKADTDRTAITEGFIEMSPATLQRVLNGDNKKGDVLGIARIAGIMASKKRPTLSLCATHSPLPMLILNLKLTHNIIALVVKQPSLHQVKPV
jgi:Molybdenum cofactor biosynthesis enzyme